ncbi:MAG: hypothetical protein RQ839_11855 [Thermoproteus sp.]|nr:hypothetical protein [Thermoproteus sp.]MDT7883042.1 hypothetical protein [Thermoproteus sp.]
MVVDAIRTGNIVVIAFLATGILSSPLFAWAWPHTAVMIPTSKTFYPKTYLPCLVEINNPPMKFIAARKFLRN